MPFPIGSLCSTEPLLQREDNHHTRAGEENILKEKYKKYIKKIYISKLNIYQIEKYIKRIYINISKIYQKKIYLNLWVGTNDEIDTLELRACLAIQISAQKKKSTF